MRRFADFVLSHPRSVLITLLAITLGLGAAATRLQIDPSVENMILEDDPDLVFYRSFLERFGSDELIVVGFRSADLFSAQSLQRIQDVSDALEAIPDIDKVISLSNVNRIAGEKAESGESVVLIEPFLRKLPRDDAERRTLRSRALGDPLYAGNFLPDSVEPDAELTTLILARLVIRPGDFEYRQKVAARVEEILEEQPGFQAAGTPILKATLGRMARDDLVWLVPVQGALTYGLLFAMFRTGAAVLLPLATVMLALTWVLGFLTLCGSYLNVVSVVILPLVQIIAITSTIHIFSHYYAHAKDPGDRRERIRDTLIKVGGPCFVASFTTAIGFLSLTASKIGPVREVGLYSAFGVLSAFLVAVTLVPLMILRFAPAHRGREPGGRRLRTALGSLSRVTDRFRWPVLVGGIAVIGVAIVGLYRVRAETDIVGFIDESHPMRAAYAFINEEIGGVEPLDFVIRTSPGGLLEPDVLRRVERFQAWLDEQPEIDHTLSIVDYLKQVNQAMHGGDPAFLRLPATREGAAEALLLLDGREDTSPFLYPSWEVAEEARILARRDDAITSADILDLLDRASEFLAQHVVTRPDLLFDREAPFPEVVGIGALDDLYYDLRRFLGAEIEWPTIPATLPEGTVAARATGVGVLYAMMADTLVRGQISSLFLAFFFIWVTLSVLLRSTWAGAVAMIPNLFPIVIVLGIMGYAGITLNLGTAMIGSICIGIAVDDTVHFLGRYRLHLAGESSPVAVGRTLRDVGSPIVTTSIALSIGFSALVLSGYQPIREFGILSAVTIIVALVGDLLLLPACLLILKPRISAPPAALPSDPEIRAIEPPSRKAASSFLAVILFCGVTSVASAMDEPNGRDIMVHVDERDRGKDSTMTGRWRLINGRGHVRERTTVSYRVELDGEDGFDSKQVIFFQSPAEVRDTGFLTWEYVDASLDDDQWTYLPSLRKVRRIAGTSREGSFFGTDFLYDDLRRRGLDEDVHRRLADVDRDGKRLFVVESIPKKDGYVYSRIVSWIDPERWVPVRVEFYDRRGRELKTMTVEWEEVDGVWVWKRAEVATGKTGHRTAILFDDVRINTGLGDSMFNVLALSKGAP